MSSRRLWVLTGIIIGFCGLGLADTKRESVTARFRSDLQFLASDQCEGRGPGTGGINLAGDHIAAAFEAAGLKPACKDGTYFQPFQVRGPAKPAKASLSLKGPNDIQLPLTGDDYSALGLTGNGKAASELIFVGHAIVHDKVPYDDFADLDVEGKIVVMLRRTPRYEGETRFADDDTMASLVDLTKKLDNAEKHKAAAVLLINDRTTITDTGDVLSPPTTRFSKTAKIPAVHIRRDIGELIVRKAFGKSLDQLEKELDKDLKPQNGLLKGWTCDMSVAIENNMIDVKNVVGVLEGSGPLADETVIIGAHYDHLDYGGRNSLARNSKDIHHGADDNASGSTAVIELARRFGAMKDRVGRRLVIMTFSAEEMGLLGSIHYCKEPIFPLEKTVAMINLDMVGRCAIDKEDNLEKNGNRRHRHGQVI